MSPPIYKKTTPPVMYMMLESTQFAKWIISLDEKGKNIRFKRLDPKESYDSAPDILNNNGRWSHKSTTKWRNRDIGKTVYLKFKRECPQTYDTQESGETDGSSERDSSKEDFIPGHPNPNVKTSGSDRTVLIAAVSSTLAVVVVAVVVVMVVRKVRARQEAKKRETVDLNPMYGDNYYDYQDRNYDDGEVEYYEGNEE